MKALEEKILKEGTVKDGGILKVDNFLNHQIDAPFLMEMGSEIKRLYSDCGVTKILTIEASAAIHTVPRLPHLHTALTMML